MPAQDILPQTKAESQRTNLIRYVPHVLVATLLVAGLPLLLAWALSGPLLDLPFVLATLASTALSVVLGKAGARLWQTRPGARDVVFYDLTVWGFIRRLWHQRCVLTHAERLAVTGSVTRSQSGEQNLKILKKLARALEAGDPFTHGHSNRVARHAYMVARTLKLPKRTCEKIRLAAALHDVGKLHTPRAILTKPGRLTDEEFEIIKRHPVDSATMVAELQDDELTAMVRHHHERIDGTGYPHRISGDDIPLGARIISVVDTFDAISSLRPYRTTRSHKDAIEILNKEAGKQLDASVVRAFINYYTGKRGIRRWMSFTSGAPSLFDFSIASLQRAAANAAVVASSAVVVAGGGMVPGLGTRAVASTQESTAQQTTGDNGESVGASADGSQANTKSTRAMAGSKSERAKARRSERTKDAEPAQGADSQPENPGNGNPDEPGGGSGDGNGDGLGNGHANENANEHANENANGNGGGGQDGGNSGPGSGNSGSGSGNSGPGSGNSGPGSGNSGPGNGEDEDDDDDDEADEADEADDDD